MKVDKTCPCRNCADRVIGCHGSCMKYTDWCVQRRQKADDLKKVKDAERAEWEYIQKAAKRMRGRKEKRR